MQFCGISFMYPYKQSGRWQDVLHRKGFNSKSLTIYSSYAILLPKSASWEPGRAKMGVEPYRSPELVNRAAGAMATGLKAIGRITTFPWNKTPVVVKCKTTLKILSYSGADKSLARPGRKQVTATEDFEFHISYL
jgi:hypothetical protein